MKKPSKMTNLQLRLKVAEILGWTFIDACGTPPRLRGNSPAVDGRKSRAAWLPNWPESLDDCHEMEEATGQGYFGYAIILAAVVRGVRPSKIEPTSGAMFDCAHATARQRCEAFVATMSEVNS